MSLIKLGDIVRIKERRPKWGNDYPIYTHEMRIFENCIYEVSDPVDFDTCVYLKEVGKSIYCSDISGYLWSINWLELVNEKPTGPILVFDDKEFLI